MSDRVYVHDIELECLIGTEPGERLGRQTVLVDVDVECDCRPSGRSDALADALDYVRLVEVVQARAAVSRFHLLEALAEDLAASLLDGLPGAEAVHLRLTKPSAIPGIPLVGIEIERRRGAGA
ncbi:MAG TPA: dihydroneopterin aldolase [Thermoanaerobaculaceae bacterium]|nr:dihydroneopterin aldolase [Thermoanaerobaculaceae bacterium]HPS78739.1 dihydroneopterin aldolase [Thermoanaerobaculaceae bacterium]